MGCTLITKGNHKNYDIMIHNLGNLSVSSTQHLTSISDCL